MASVTLGTGITAYAGGGLENATPLTKEYNKVTVCASDGDSVLLPGASAGVRCGVYNATTKILAIFPLSTPIDGGDEADSYLLLPGFEVWFTAVSTTAWDSSNPEKVEETQATNITTGVTVNGLSGLITTQNASAGAAGATPNTFRVTNSKVRAESRVNAWIQNYAGTYATNGTPIVNVQGVADGLFDIVISNAHGTNALSAALKIGFEVLN